jgi:hypothetical protein
VRLPASTQWELMAKARPALEPVQEALISLAAQGQLIVLLRQRCVPGDGRGGNVAARVWQQMVQRRPTPIWRSG